jgi:hypothetical protein
MTEAADAQGYAERYAKYQRGKFKRGPYGYNYGLGGGEANLIRFEVDRMIQARGGTLAHPSVYAQQNATDQRKRQEHYESLGLDPGPATAAGLRKLAADWRAGRVKAPEFSLKDDD